MNKHTFNLNFEALHVGLLRRYSELLCTLGKTLKNDKLRERGEKFWHPARVSHGESQICMSMQNITFPVDLYDAEKIMVILVPEHNVISGGIFSFFAIADQMRRLKKQHGHEILIMTRPNPDCLTYFRNTNFRNAENVYRFEQILLCKAAKEIYLHIPEYEAEFFANHISNEEREYLLGRRNVHINILNQNIKLMPEKECFSGLRDISNSLTQSVAHHAYFTQAMADKYELPTLLLPPFTDLSAYPPIGFGEKEKLIIYSPDDAPHKKRCLEQISQNLPDFELVEICNITFDRFMDYATRCMFSISFGEGFDGYVAQPIHQGGIGFTVYNDDFFPSRHFLDYDNIFTDADEMVKSICNRILLFSENRQLYERLNKQWQEEYLKLYRHDKYVEQLTKLSLKKFELFPQSENDVIPYKPVKSIALK